MTKIEALRSQRMTPGGSGERRIVENAVTLGMARTLIEATGLEVCTP
jgi:hypothetical protein